MVTTRQFPTRGVLRRPRFAPVDVLVALGMVAILYGAVRLGAAMGSPSTHVGESVSTAMRNLPYYAARSLLRMFIALGLSTAFTFLYGTAAARSRRWRVVLIPFLDILQSVPILG